MTNNIIALSETPVGTPLNGIGAIGAAGSTPIPYLAGLISAAVGIMTIIGVVYFLFNLITGATAMISSGGDKGRYEDARNKLTYGFIGLIVTISAIFIMGLVAIILNVPDILNLDQIMKF